MPFTLPTPPSEDSIENLDIDTSNGVILTEHASHNPATQVPSSASSVDTPNTMHGNNFGTFLATDDSMLLELTEDEDQDMSDGGAALASTLSHEGHIQIDIDIFNAEAMEPNNLGEMPTDLVLVDLHQAAPYIANYNFAYGPGEGLEDFEPPLPVPPMPDAATTDLPAVMSEVSHQLQHIQDGQEHGDLELSQAEHHELFMSHNQSTASFPFTSLSPVSVTAVTQNGAATVVSSQSQPPALVGSAQAPNEAINSWANASVIYGFSFGQAGLFNSPSHLPSSDVIWADDQESDADHTEVEDQINMNFGAFLLDWADQARIMRRAKDRRYRGPAAHGVARYSTENDIDPVTINDLKGEECDFQRIDWSELGVSRLEARQMRRQTYKNYTNLRYVNPPQWHVS
ncbi:WD domain-containing protein [Rutstroemia sp. NJR-2017a BVV2]|nr:WD domain-containing protein [Rutstroemia sp. NJR-2017a BVV2]